MLTAHVHTYSLWTSHNFKGRALWLSNWVRFSQGCCSCIKNKNIASWKQCLNQTVKKSTSSTTDAHWMKSDLTGQVEGQSLTTHAVTSGGCTTMAALEPRTICNILHKEIILARSKMTCCTLKSLWSSCCPSHYFILQCKMRTINLNG